MPWLKDIQHSSEGSPAAKADRDCSASTCYPSWEPASATELRKLCSSIFRLICSRAKLCFRFLMVFVLVIWSITKFYCSDVEMLLEFELQSSSQCTVGKSEGSAKISSIGHNRVCPLNASWTCKSLVGLSLDVHCQWLWMHSPLQSNSFSEKKSGLAVLSRCLRLGDWEILKQPWNASKVHWRPEIAEVPWALGKLQINARISRLGCCAMPKDWQLKFWKLEKQWF